MKSKLKAILDDDRGVSPVIGVILMVAITVILAAVIGTFVLGLGDSLNQAPQAQLTVENDTSTAGQFTISHDGGDAIDWGETNVNIDTGNINTAPSGELTVGNSVDVPTDNSANTDITVTIVHQPSESILVQKEITV